MSYFQAIILAIIEGLTEFLPISSTGHLIIGSSFFGIADDKFTKLFTIVIQLGTILSVVVLYYKRFFQSMAFYYKLFIGFIPAVIFGLLLNDYIDELLESPVTVAISLIIGGIILLKVDRWFNYQDSVKQMGYLDALKIGFFQCLAMIPGTSRSGATIVGAMSQGYSRKVAAEFSFFLAIPTMLGATVKKTYDFFNQGYQLTDHQVNVLILGNIVGFLVALIAIKSFIGYISKYGFKWFGIYRILLGTVLLVIHYQFKSLSI